MPCFLPRDRQGRFPFCQLRGRKSESRKRLTYTSLRFVLHHAAAFSTFMSAAKIRGAVPEAIVAAPSRLSSGREHKVLQPVDKI
jgi:hypothetical protein